MCDDTLKQSVLSAGLFYSSLDAGGHFQKKKRVLGTRFCELITWKNLVTCTENKQKIMENILQKWKKIKPTMLLAFF